MDTILPHTKADSFSMPGNVAVTHTIPHPSGSHDIVLQQQMTAGKSGKKILNVGFFASNKNPLAPTNKGVAGPMLGTIKKLVTDFAKKTKPNEIQYKTQKSGGTDKRARVYTKMIKRIAGKSPRETDHSKKYSPKTGMKSHVLNMRGVKLGEARIDKVNNKIKRHNDSLSGSEIRNMFKSIHGVRYAPNSGQHVIAHIDHPEHGTVYVGKNRLVDSPKRAAKMNPDDASRLHSQYNRIGIRSLSRAGFPKHPHHAALETGEFGFTPVMSLSRAGTQRVQGDKDGLKRTLRAAKGADNREGTVVRAKRMENSRAREANKQAAELNRLANKKLPPANENYWSYDGEKKYLKPGDKYVHPPSSMPKMSAADEQDYQKRVQQGTAGFYSLQQKRNLKRGQDHVRTIGDIKDVLKKLPKFGLNTVHHMIKGKGDALSSFPHELPHHTPYLTKIHDELTNLHGIIKNAKSNPGGKTRDDISSIRSIKRN